MGDVVSKTYNIDKSKENKLGEGTFAEVYKISSKLDKKPYAAKIFKQQYDDMIVFKEIGQY
jgi:serine/threonine protein kinase